MSSNKEYHDFLRFLYFEGYADSYEEAEELVESLSDDEIEYLYEARRKRKLAHSFPLTKKERKYVSNIGRRSEGEIVPAEGDEPEPKPEPEPSPTKSASRTIRRSDLSSIIKDQFDLVADYLFSEGYADSLDGAEVMAENISDNWVNEILDEKYVKELDTTGRGPDHRNRFPKFHTWDQDPEVDPIFTRRRARKNDKKIDPYFSGRKERKDKKRQGTGGFVA